MQVSHLSRGKPLVADLAQGVILVTSPHYSFQILQIANRLRGNG